MLKDRLYEIGESVLRVSKADSTVVLVHGERSRLVRFANSVIHQNTEVYDISLSIHVRFGNKAATVSTNAINDPKDIAGIVRKAEELAKLSPDNPDLPEVAPAGKIETASDPFDEITAEVEPHELVDLAAKLIKETPEPFEAFGGVSGGSAETVLLTSEGFVGYRGVTAAHLKYNPIHDLTFGYLVQQSAHTFRDLNPEAALERAGQRAHLVLKPADAEPGRWTVILEPLAVGELLSFLNWIGLSAKSVQEGRSPLAGKLGEKVFSDNFTLYDDPLNPRGYVIPFDMEGRRKGLITVVEDGVLKDFAYDSVTAKKEGKESNACAISPFQSMPMFANLRVAEGDTDYNDLISSVDRGLLVTRFWYSNVVDPRTLTITGMTRDGLFVIEDGKIVGSMKNMRFNVSLLEVFSNVLGVSRQSDLVGEPTWYGSFRIYGEILPTLKVKDFNFASATKF